MSYVSQSFRFTKVNLCIATPIPDYIDIHLRQLADFWLVGQTRGHMRVYKVSMNPFRKRALQTKFLCDLRLTLPSDELVDAYEEKRKEVMESNYAEYLRETQSQREKRMEKSKDWVQEALKIGIPELRNRQGEISYSKIMKKLCVPQSRAYSIKFKLEEMMEQGEL